LAADPVISSERGQEAENHRRRPPALTYNN
jgi:hypothetical protein